MILFLIFLNSAQRWRVLCCAVHTTPAREKWGTRREGMTFGFGL